MICLSWWAWMLLFIVGGWCQRFGGDLYDLFRARRRQRVLRSLFTSPKPSEL